MSERRRGSGVMLAVAMLLVGCRGATPDPEPGAKQTAPRFDDEMGSSADKGVGAPHGEVQGVKWELYDDDQGVRLEIHRGEARSTVAVVRDEQGCYISDAAEGRWCELPELARTLILFHPDVVKPAPQ